jgi:hypothetical protein
VNLILEIGAPLHSFHKIAQWATRANSCGHIFKPDDCPHYKTYLKDFTKRLKLESLSCTMEDVLVPWGGRVKHRHNLRDRLAGAGQMDFFHT